MGTSAQSVINNYIKAVGGKERLEGVKTKITLLDASMQGMQRNTRLHLQVP